MAQDPYELLGVAKTAIEDEIRKAYRKLAKELHPDLNPGDAGAEERFKEVTAAYDLLSDKDKRARYDKGEIDASGAERAYEHFYRRYAEADGGGRYASNSGFEDFSGMSDLFSELFARRGGGQGTAFRARGSDLRFSLQVSFLDAANGATRRIVLPEGGTLDLAIPAGTRDGAVLRLKEKGAPGLGGGPPGDALVAIAVADHPVFRREGDDIVLDLPVTIDEAALGRGLTTLNEFPSAPYWTVGRVNCDEAEIASGVCVGEDGTELPLDTAAGRGDALVATVPVPMRIRPPSNYFWRSDPYRVNGEGDANALYPGVDFRLAYWMGRHLRVR